MYFITDYVKRELSFIAVKSDDQCLKLVYKQYLNTDL